MKTRRFNGVFPADLYDWAVAHVGKGNVTRLVIQLLQKEREADEKRKFERRLRRRRISDGVPQV